jgi:hypothetical protein
MIEEAEVVQSVGRAYLLGVGSTTLVLCLWLLAATITLARLYQRGRSASANVLAAVYVFLGYVGYLLLLDPITIWFMNRVAIVEPFVLHPTWVRVVIPAVSIAVWLLVLHFVRRKVSSTAPDHTEPTAVGAKSPPNSR